jgi:peptide/nickel transport system ATP-binding protein
MSATTTWGTTTGSLLRASSLRAAYSTGGDTEVMAVDDVSIDVREGEVLGIAGESGSGKSTLGAVLSLTHRPPLHVRSGELEVEGETVRLGAGQEPPRLWRGKVVSLLPQGAMNSISPTLRIRDFAFDVIRAHEPGAKRADAIDRTRERLTQLSLPARVLDYYPHQLSGGMKQRVVTVLSTLLDPKLLIADEPTSALDVSSQRILIEMLRDMLDQRIISGVIFVTHDLPVLNTVADRIAIMYAGKVVEIGAAQEIINRAWHPYSGALLQSVLVPEPQVRRRRVAGIPGSPPNLANPPQACRFHPRCPMAMEICHQEDPPQVGDDRRFSLCWWSKDNPGKSVLSEVTR